MKLTDTRSGFTSTVSPLSMTPRPSAPAAQCAMALPGKCPPGWISVISGTTCSVPDHGRITGSGRATQARSASETSTGASSRARLHST